LPRQRRPLRLYHGSNRPAESVREEGLPAGVMATRQYNLAAKQGKIVWAFVLPRTCIEPAGKDWFRTLVSLGRFQIRRRRPRWDEIMTPEQLKELRDLVEFINTELKVI